MTKWNGQFGLHRKYVFHYQCWNHVPDKDPEATQACTSLHTVTVYPVPARHRWHPHLKMPTAHHTGVCLHPPLPLHKDVDTYCAGPLGNKQSQAHYNMVKLRVAECLQHIPCRIALVQLALHTNRDIRQPRLHKWMQFLIRIFLRQIQAYPSGPTQR